MALRILANENVSLETVEALRAEGHDVIWATTLTICRACPRCRNSNNTPVG